jgi:hypothetical protein
MDRTTIFLLVAALTFPCLLLFSNVIVCEKKGGGWKFNPLSHKCDATYMLLICALWTFVIFFVVNSFLSEGSDLGMNANGNANSNA